MPPLPTVDLTGTGVRLRAGRETDVPDLLRALQDPDIPRFTLWPADLTERQARERLLAAERWRRAGERLELMVVRSRADELLGFIGLSPVWDQSRAEVFFWTAPWARRQGVASEALRLLCPWAFDELGLDCLELRSDEDNDRSQRTARAVGFRAEGRLRASRQRDGRRLDDVMFSLRPGELIEAPG